MIRFERFKCFSSFRNFIQTLISKFIQIGVSENRHAGKSLIRFSDTGNMFSNLINILS